MSDWRDQKPYLPWDGQLSACDVAKRRLREGLVKKYKTNAEWADDEQANNAGLLQLIFLELQERRRPEIEMEVAREWNLYCRDRFQSECRRFNKSLSSLSDRVGISVEKLQRMSQDCRGGDITEHFDCYFCQRVRQEMHQATWNFTERVVRPPLRLLQKKRLLLDSIKTTEELTKLHNVGKVKVQAILNGKSPKGALA